MHHLDSILVAAHALLVEDSVGVQACLEDPEYVPCTPLRRPDGVPTFPGEGVGGGNENAVEDRSGT